MLVIEIALGIVLAVLILANLDVISALAGIAIISAIALALVLGLITGGVAAVQYGKDAAFAWLAVVGGFVVVYALVLLYEDWQGKKKGSNIKNSPEGIAAPIDDAIKRRSAAKSRRAIAYIGVFLLGYSILFVLLLQFTNVSR